MQRCKSHFKDFFKGLEKVKDLPKVMEQRDAKPCPGLLALCLFHWARLVKRELTLQRLALGQPSFIQKVPFLSITMTFKA